MLGSLGIWENKNHYFRPYIRTCNVSASQNETIEDDEVPAASHRPVHGGFIDAMTKPPHFAVALILLGTTLVLTQGIEFREKIPPNKTLSQSPVEIGQ